MRCEVLSGMHTGVGPKLMAIRIYFWDSSGFSCPIQGGVD